MLTESQTTQDARAPIENGIIGVLPLFNDTVYRYREIAHPDKFWLLRNVSRETVCLVHDITRSPPGTFNCVRHLISWDVFERDFERVELSNVVDDLPA